MKYSINYLSLNNKDLVVNETIFHNANGYIGIRNNFEEAYPSGYNTVRGSYINAFYDFAEMKQAENFYGLANEKQTMLNVADTQGVKLFLGDEQFNLWKGSIISAKRTLDMDCGFTERYIVWRSPMGKEVEIIIRRLTSFVRLPLFLIDYSVKALNFSDNLYFVSVHLGAVMNHANPDDPRLAAESARYIIPGKVHVEETASFITSSTSKSGLKLCTGVDHVIMSGGHFECNSFAEKESAWTEIKIGIKEGEKAGFCKYSVFTDSLRYADCEKSASEELAKAVATGPLEIYREQKEYLDKFWDNAFLKIEGNERLNMALNYNMYQLLQSAGKESKSSVGAKGLSGEGYEGHYFWDTEMYIEPFFNLTVPEISKNLVSFRYSILDEARKNARLLGHKQGALFSWRTIMGKESSGFFPAGSAQYHISGDIAWSIVSYYFASGDYGFIVEKGAEMIFEIARLWIDAGTWYKGQFCIHCVTGPDEYTCMVNNNYYTNLSAKFSLYWAVRFYSLLKDSGDIEALAERIKLCPEELEEFSRAEKAVYLPYDENQKLNPQDDSFLSKKKWDLSATPKEKFPLLLHYHPLHLYRYQVCKQADTVLAHFIFEDAQSEETIRNSFLYYEGITTHDSSLSACIFSIVASKLKLYEKAYKYFGNSAMLDLYDLHNNTKDGIHTANMGGAWMAIVYGFAGLRIKEDGISLAPWIPQKWESLCFRINYRGSRIQLKIEKSRVTIVLLNGAEKEIKVYGKPYTLKDRLEIPVNYSEPA
ncbi:MAG: family 65 glycosyl hydrolase [Treponema sp.]|jgi:alpha,alpha-trehalose phosphorylase|nr:family 65 glycosyl hydrolase [Treponema sp.]